MPPAFRLVDGSELFSPPTARLAAGRAEPASRSGGNRGPIHDPAALAQLREAVRRIEGLAPGWSDEAAAHGSALPLGIAAIDEHLPWGGLPKGALHEIAATDTASAGVASALCAYLCALSSTGTVLWCEGARTLDAGALHPPGLRRFGLAPERLVVARTKNDAETLWAMEDGLRCTALAAVIGALAEISLTESRRLQLAAEASGVTALILRPAGAGLAPNAAITRWRAQPIPGGASDGAPDDRASGIFTAALAPLRWRLELFRCRGGMPGNWDVEWRDETRDLALATALCNRQDRPVRQTG